MPHLDKAPPLHWLGLVLTPQGVYRSWFSLLGKDSPRFEFIPSSAENSLAEQAQAIPEVQTYLWFARFPVKRSREEGARHIVEYSDLCHPQMSDFRVVLGKHGGVLAVGFADGS